MQMNVGKIIRNKRLEAGWSQERLASEAGVSQPSIRKIESGETKHSKFLARIAHVLGLQLADLDPGMARAARTVVADAVVTKQLRDRQSSSSNGAASRSGIEPVALSQVTGTREDLPVYSMVFDRQEDALLLSAGPYTKIVRPHSLSGILGTFAILIRDTNNVLAREYNDGDTAEVNPHRHPVVGNACLFSDRAIDVNADGSLKQLDGEPQRRLKIGYLIKPVEFSATHWNIEWVNPHPPRKLTISREEFPFCYVMVGKNSP